MKNLLCKDERIYTEIYTAGVYPGFFLGGATINPIFPFFGRGYSSPLSSPLDTPLYREIFYL